MRSIALAAAFVAATVGLTGGAFAGMTVNVQKSHYEIAGKTGAALLDAMERRGPKHGFLTRAIAQTRYSVGWNMVWAERDRSCRVKSADATLSMTYTYPLLTGDVPPQLRKR